MRCALTVSRVRGAVPRVRSSLHTRTYWASGNCPRSPPSNFLPTRRSPALVDAAGPPKAMPQGKFKPGKTSGSIVKKKSLGKSVHKGDQQKLKRGNHVIKPKGKVAIAEGRVQLSITKGINARIEKTMTARTGGDGGKLHILKEDESGAPLGAPLKTASHSKTQKKK